MTMAPLSPDERALYVKNLTSSSSVPTLCAQS